MKDKWKYLVEVALVVAVAPMMFSDMFEIDTCVETGGRWNEISGQCQTVSGWAFLHHGKG